ncbi:hypothetical protein [Pseudomonas synxantha]|nr:hypothetical protein [Pseudomonas synxantha]
MAALGPTRMLDQTEYISVVWVTAAIGSALTAGHFRKAGMPAQAKVTKALLPHHSAPRSGSVCP